MKLFLDLEETVIRSWTNPTLCNVHKIRQYIQKIRVSEISIFSFAIYNNEDKDYFERNIKEHIETALGVDIMEWPSVDEINSVFFNNYGIHFDRHEFINIWGKSRAFTDYCKATQSGVCILIDDVVPNELLFVWERPSRTEIVIETINVNNLEKLRYE